MFYEELKTFFKEGVLYLTKHLRVLIEYFEEAIAVKGYLQK